MAAEGTHADAWGLFLFANEVECFGDIAFEMEEAATSESSNSDEARSVSSSVRGTSPERDEEDLVDEIKEQLPGSVLVLETDSASGAKRRIRRGRYKRLHLFLPIIKRDFRRLLPNMYMNVINWNDPNLLRRFFNVVYRDQSEIVNHQVAHLTAIIPLIRGSSTRDLTVLQCAYKAAVSPDTCVTMQACELRRSTEASEETRIVMNLKYYGTLLYDLNIEEALACFGLSSTEMAQPPRVCRDIDLAALRRHTSLRSNPAYIEVEGQFVLSIHETKFITKAEFFSTAFRSTPLH